MRANASVKSLRFTAAKPPVSPASVRRLFCDSCSSEAKPRAGTSIGLLPLSPSKPSEKPPPMLASSSPASPRGSMA